MNNEEYVVKRAFDEFLKIACEKAKGDTRKSMSIHEIWDNNFPMTSLNKEDYLPNILSSLRANQFIQYGNNKDEIKVTYRGIYYVINTFHLPPTHLGVLSYEDLNRFLDLFLKTIYDIAKGHHSRKVKIYEIENSLNHTFGTQAVHQVTEFLKMKGLVEPGENENEIQIPSINTKKSYEAPGARFGSS